MEARERTHGNFHYVAFVTNRIRRSLRSGPQWGDLDDRQRLALDEIALKMARIVCGNPDFPDHWIDIEGYAHKAAP